MLEGIQICGLGQSLIIVAAFVEEFERPVFLEGGTVLGWEVRSRPGKEKVHFPSL